MWYVKCKCGNLVTCEERHDISVLPCPGCKQHE